MYIKKVGNKISRKIMNIRTRKQVYLEEQVKEITQDKEILSTKEITKIEEKYGYKYKTATGMILFAYMLYRLDIGFLLVCFYFFIS